MIIIIVIVINVINYCTDEQDASQSGYKATCALFRAVFI